MHVFCDDGNTSMSYMKIEFQAPTPTAEFLTKDFRLQPGLDWKFLLRRAWSEQKLFSLQFPELSLP